MTSFPALLRLLFPFVLLATGTAAAVDAKSDNGNTPLLNAVQLNRVAAARESDAELVGRLIDRGAQVGGMSVDIFD